MPQTYEDNYNHNCYDKVELFNCVGCARNATPFDKLCGRFPSGVELNFNSGRYLTMNFTSDSSGQATGFYANVRVTKL